MDVVDLLHSYVDAGLAVLPLHALRNGRCTCGRDCPSPAKHPLTRNGKDDATLNLGVVAEWLARWPGCNWGIRPAVGCIVLDVDPRNGGDVELAALEHRHGNLPPTLTARTGSGGHHLWFSYNGPARGKLCTGVDVKTNTGYLVAPPSTHICGGTYEWIDFQPAQYLPQWVKDILNPPIRAITPGAHRAGNIEALIRFVAGAAEGERNARLYWAACRAHEKGLDPEPLIDTAVSIGLPRTEAAATIRSAGHAAPRDMRKQAIR